MKQIILFLLLTSLLVGCYSPAEDYEQRVCKIMSTRFSELTIQVHYPLGCAVNIDGEWLSIKLDDIDLLLAIVETQP